MADEKYARLIEGSARVIGANYQKADVQGDFWVEVTEFPMPGDQPVPGKPGKFARTAAPDMVGGASRKTTIAQAFGGVAVVLPPVPINPPTITGDAKVGSTLTRVNGTWAGTGITYTHQWLADDVEITGETKSTYVVRAADLGKRIKSRTTATIAGAVSVSAFTAATAIVVAADVVVTNPAPAAGYANLLASPKNLEASPPWYVGAGNPKTLSGQRFVIEPGDVRQTAIFQTITVQAGKKYVIEMNYDKVPGSGAGLPRATFYKVGDSSSTFAGSELTQSGNRYHTSSVYTATADGELRAYIETLSGSDNGCDINIQNFGVGVANGPTYKASDAEYTPAVDRTQEWITSRNQPSARLPTKSDAPIGNGLVLESTAVNVAYLTFGKTRSGATVPSRAVLDTLVDYNMHIGAAETTTGPVNDNPTQGPSWTRWRRYPEGHPYDTLVMLDDCLELRVFGKNNNDPTWRYGEVYGGGFTIPWNIIPPFVIKIRKRWPSDERAWCPSWLYGGVLVPYKLVVGGANGQYDAYDGAQWANVGANNRSLIQDTWHTWGPPAYKNAPAVTASTTAGSNVVQCSDTSGIVVGMQIALYKSDGSRITANDVRSVTSNSITLKDAMGETATVAKIMYCNSIRCYYEDDKPDDAYSTWSGTANGTATGTQTGGISIKFGYHSNIILQPIGARYQFSPKEVHSPYTSFLGSGTVTDGRGQSVTVSADNGLYANIDKSAVYVDQYMNFLPDGRRQMIVFGVLFHEQYQELLTDTFFNRMTNKQEPIGYTYVEGQQAGAEFLIDPTTGAKMGYGSTQVTDNTKFFARIAEISFWQGGNITQASIIKPTNAISQVAALGVDKLGVGLGGKYSANITGMPAFGTEAFISDASGNKIGTGSNGVALSVSGTKITSDTQPNAEGTFTFYLGHYPVSDDPNARPGTGIPRIQQFTVQVSASVSSLNSLSANTNESPAGLPFVARISGLAASGTTLTGKITPQGGADIALSVSGDTVYTAAALSTLGSYTLSLTETPASGAPNTTTIPITVKTNRVPSQDFSAVATDGATITAANKAGPYGATSGIGAAVQATFSPAGSGINIGINADAQNAANGAGTLSAWVKTADANPQTITQYNGQVAVDFVFDDGSTANHFKKGQWVKISSAQTWNAFRIYQQQAGTPNFFLWGAAVT